MENENESLTVGTGDNSTEISVGQKLTHVQSSVDQSDQSPVVSDKTPQSELKDNSTSEQLASSSDLKDRELETSEKPDAILSLSSQDEVDTQPKRNHLLPPSAQDQLMNSGERLQLRPPSPSLRKETRHTLEDYAERFERKAKTVLSSLLPAALYSRLSVPWSDDEHPGLTVSEQVPVLVRESNISSIVAYALSSDMYIEGMNRLKSQPTQLKTMKSKDAPSNEEPGSRGLSYVRSSDVNRSDSSLSGVRYTPQLEESSDSTSSGVDVVRDPDAADEPDADEHNSDIEIEFQDTSTRFFCKVYLADQFRELRRVVFAESENRYIRSLAHCAPWLAKGGKSGSSFCKTKDDRFVLKQMSRFEMKSFHEFGPQYIQYLLKCHADKTPTCLGKILGVYRVSFRNGQTGNATKQDLLVMENLFYGHRLSQVFDLKGSQRNRHVKTDGKAPSDVVLLDENFIQMSQQQPLYVRSHAKNSLRAALHRDSLFLASRLVMDYSLLVGLSVEGDHVVVGIIDYLRTFTWDKKLETVVKSSGLLGGQGKTPTIVSPESYRARFLKAMNDYFQEVPDRWFGLEKFKTEKESATGINETPATS